MVRFNPALVALLAVLLCLVVSRASAQEFEFAAPNMTVPAELSGDTTFVVGFTIEQVDGVLADTLGFSMSVAHDPAVLSVDSVDYGPAVIDDVWGEPWAFYTEEHANGWSCGVVYSFLGDWFYQFPVPAVAIEVTYTASATLELPAATPLNWVNDLGPNPIANLVVVNGISLPTPGVDGQITVGPALFLRGDMNGDGAIDLADVFSAKDYLFLGGETPGCLAAFDTNHDGTVDISDIIYELSYLFLGSEPMAAPFPDCGPLPAGSALGCAESQCIP